MLNRPPAPEWYFHGPSPNRCFSTLNFPFWLVENLLVVVYGLHVGFSSMDPEHQRYFLRKKLLRPPRERTLALIPALAEMVYKIGVAVHALITLSHFSQLKHRAAIGYVPADARDRLQGDYPSARPPFNTSSNSDGVAHAGRSGRIGSPQR